MKTYCIILLTLIPFLLNGQIISTFAGRGSGGDGGLATAASLYDPEDITIDKFGNIYIAQALNNKIRKIDVSGIITTVAGTGAAGFSGDGGLATTALLNEPDGITADTLGNIFFADEGNQRIRKIDISTGIISTICGNGTTGFTGDNGPAAAAELNYPLDICFDNFGNLYIADNANHRVRKINQLGIITTIAGNGIQANTGDGGMATIAACTPVGICTDLSGNLFIAEESSALVREVTITGYIKTVAGDSVSYIYNGDGIPATSAQVGPNFVKIGPNNLLYISDFANSRIRIIDAAGIIHTVVGDSVAGYSGDGGPATDAEIYYPGGICFDSCGNLYIAEIQNSDIRKVTYPECHYLVATLDIKGDAENKTLSIYPNPIDNVLNIDGVSTGTGYAIINITGITEQRGTLKQGNNTLSLQSLPPGIYLLQLTDNEGQKTISKIIKQ